MTIFSGHFPRTFMKSRAAFVFIAGIGASILPQQSIAQAAAPLRRLSSPDAVSSRTMGAIESVRELADGRVLVNDARYRQVLIIDRQLSGARVLIDSVSTDSIRYGLFTSPLVAYRGDSTLFHVANSSLLHVIDPSGQIVGRLPSTTRGEKPPRILSLKGLDVDGNPIYAALTFALNFGDRWYEAAAAPIVRMNYATGREESVAHFQRAPEFRMQQQKVNGKMQPIRTFNPLVLVDDWTVLSDGTVAVVHAKDYNVELMRPDGKRVARTKLPFVKRTLSDAEKIEEASVRRAAVILDEQEIELVRGIGNGAGAMAAALSLGLDSLTRVAQKANGSVKVALPPYAPVIDLEPVPISHMLDFLPPFRPGAVIADRSARVWIRTTMTTGAPDNDVLYDVVNNLGDHVQRVAVPANRTIVGFGPNDVIYVKSREGLNSWRLERRRIVQ